MRILRGTILALGALLLAAAPAWAKLNVLTTTADLAALAAEIGGPDADVSAVAKGTQDPHFIEAKPSYMVKASHADLVLAVGLDLEIGWLPSILNGARNPKVLPSATGYLEVGPLVETLDKPTGKTSRADGDVHPLGNPHISLDPIRMGAIGLKVAEKMGELDAAHAEAYSTRALALQKRLTEKTVLWSARVKATGVTEVVTYHPTLAYFLDRFHLKAAAYLEPKPGIPPTSKHILEVMDVIKTRKVPLILVENFFDPTVCRRITQDLPDVKVKSVAVSVGGDNGLNSLDDLYESLVAAVEGGKP